MAWPSAQDYNEAIQSPRLCFVDPSLRTGTVRVNALGLPRAICGAFASVYEMTLPGSGGKWAIRCFLSAADNQERRYTEISKALSALRLPYTVGFRYQSPGMRVNGRDLPIVSMEWLTGDLLGDYIHSNFSNPGRMRDLAAKWAAMIAELRRNNIAHGDLQHGNVLIVNHEIRLVDYDGVFVPALTGLKATEDGHPNYQHPGRRGLFSPSIDNFSGWVVYCSLRILELDPTIYALSRRLGHDDCIIFNKEDYLSPALSQLFNYLKIHPNPTIVRASTTIERLVKQDVLSVPPLDTSAVGASSTVSSTDEPWWKTEVTQTSEPPLARSTKALPAESDPLFEGFPDQTPTKIEMLVLAGCAFGLFVLFPRVESLGYATQPIFQMAVLALGYFRLRFVHSRSPAAAQRTKLLLELHARDESHAAQTRRSQSLNEELRLQQVRIAKLSSELQQARTALGAKQASELNEIRIKIAAEKQQIEVRFRQLAGEEKAAIQREAGARQAEVSQLTQNLNEQVSRKHGIISNALGALQKSQLDDRLRRHDILGATFPGVGDGFKRKLIGSGIKTAADVEYGLVRRIRGFGSARTSAILDWKRALAAHHSPNVSQTLPTSELSRINSIFDPTIQALRSQLQVAQAQVDGVSLAVTRRYSDVRQQAAAAGTASISSLAARQDALLKGQAAQLAKLQRDSDRDKENLIRSSTQTTMQAQAVAADLQKSERDRRQLAKRIAALADADFGHFLRSTFFTPLWPVPEDPADRSDKRPPVIACAILTGFILLTLVLEGQLHASQEQIDFTPLTGELELWSNVNGVNYSILDVNRTGAVALPGNRPGIGPSSTKIVRGFRPGIYRVVATSPEWLSPVFKDVTIGDAEKIKTNFVFERGAVGIESSPEGASVWESGKNLGVTPLTLAAQTAEPHTYTLTFEDWEPFTKTVDLRTDHTLSHVWPHGTAHITSNPIGAHVVQASKDLGVTPLSLANLKPGPITYELQLPGYEPTEVTGKIEDGQTTTLDAFLIDVVNTGTADVTLPSDSPFLTIRNTGGNPLIVFEITLVGQTGQVLEKDTGPGFIAPNQSTNVATGNSSATIGQVLLKTDPKQVAITLIRQKHFEPNDRVDEPQGASLPDYAAAITFDPRSRVVEFWNKGRRPIYLTSVIIKTAGKFRRDRKVPLGYYVWTGKSSTVPLIGKLGTGDVITFDTLPHLSKDQAVVKILP